MKPYFVWKKSAKNANHTGEKLVIWNTQSQNNSLSEHLQKGSNNKIDLSLVVPSYNEQQRLPIMLNESIEFLNSMKINYEIIVVNDGSKDKTTQVATQKGKQKNANLFVVEYPKNRGKGGAVRAGMAAASGDQILMVDADGATTFSELIKMRKKLQEIKQKVGHPLIMVVGSRSHLDE